MLSYTQSEINQTVVLNMSHVCAYAYITGVHKKQKLIIIIKKNTISKFVYQHACSLIFQSYKFRTITTAALYTCTRNRHGLLLYIYIYSSIINSSEGVNLYCYGTHYTFIIYVQLLFFFFINVVLLFINNISFVASV